MNKFILVLVVLFNCSCLASILVGSYAVNSVANGKKHRLIPKEDLKSEDPLTQYTMNNNLKVFYNGSSVFISDIIMKISIECYIEKDGKRLNPSKTYVSIYFCSDLDFMAKEGTYNMVTTSKCHENTSSKFTVSKDSPYEIGVTYTINIERKTAYLNDSFYDLPPGSELKLYHVIPDESGNCSFGLFQLKNSGRPEQSGALILMELSKTSETYSGITPEQYLQNKYDEEQLSIKKYTEKIEREERELAAKEEMISLQELKEKKCTQERNEDLQNKLKDINYIFEKNEIFKSLFGSPYLRLLDHDIFVTTEKGVDFSYKTIGGELHIYAIGYNDITLESTDGRGNKTTTESDYSKFIKNNISKYSDSNSFISKSGDKIKITVNGSGCSLVAIFAKY